MNEKNFIKARTASVNYHFGKDSDPICPSCGVECVDMGVMADEETGNARDWECPQCGESVWIEE